MRSEGDAIRSLQRFAASVLAEPWDVRRTLESGEDPQRPFAIVEQNAPAIPATAVGRSEAMTAPYTVNCYLPLASERQAASDAALELRELWLRAVKFRTRGDTSLKDRIPLFDYSDRLQLDRIKVASDAADFTLLYAADETEPIPFDADPADIVNALDSIGLEGDALQVARVGSRLFDLQIAGELGGVQQPLDAGERCVVTPRLTATQAPWRTDRDFMEVRSYGASTIPDEDDPRLVQVAIDLRLTFVVGAQVPFGETVLQRVVPQRV